MNSQFKLSGIIALLMLAAFLPACKTSPTSVTVSTPPLVVGKQFSGDTLRGQIQGTVPNTYPAGTAKAGQPHTTYYMDSTVIIPLNDTLLIQSGITIIMLNTGPTNPVGAPEFQVYGTFICAGQKGAPIYLTVPANLRKYASLTDATSPTLWGGIECAGASNKLTNQGSGDLILKWTHIEFAGGASAVSDPIVSSGGTRYAVWYQNPNGHFIMEDSWLTGSTDDPLRVSGGKISIFRNVVECAAPTSGDFNFKTGTVGDIAYNVFIGICTNGPKLANTNGITPECNVNIYNNTMVTCGWRVTKPSRGGSTDIEDGARGTEYNNLIVNCRVGFRLYDAPIADTADTQYGYQYYYGSVDTIVSLFYPSDANVGGVQNKRPGDVAGAAKANDPKFVGYVVDQFPPAVFATFPAPFQSQLAYPALNLMRSMDENGNPRFTDVQTPFKSDFHLGTGSKAIANGYTGAVKLNNGTAVSVPIATCPAATDANHIFGTYNVKGLGADMGAYQTDGSGNQQ